MNRSEILLGLIGDSWAGCCNYCVCVRERASNECSYNTGIVKSPGNILALDLVVLFSGFTAITALLLK